MKTITKYFASIKAASTYQNRLYNKYNYVRLVGFPQFSNNGNYTWEVN